MKKNEYSTLATLSCDIDISVDLIWFFFFKSQMFLIKMQLLMPIRQKNQINIHKIVYKTKKNTHTDGKRFFLYFFHNLFLRHRLRNPSYNNRIIMFMLIRFLNSIQIRARLWHEPMALTGKHWWAGICCQNVSYNSTLGVSISSFS